MPASRTDVRHARWTDRSDGLMAAPIGAEGAWAAFRSLRVAMRDLRQVGLRPEVLYALAVARDGRIVRGRDPEAALLLLGYRLSGPS